ncbi:hypothetical protein [Sphingomonas sp.]|uniref:hypothetical protein n=1 Tax=Sphingomonas sp. TaxID=28214 RepID=UPI0031D4BB6C
MDLRTILKAIELVGDNLPAAKALYEGFIAVTRGADQDELKARYEAAKLASDELHQRIQDA